MNDERYPEYADDSRQIEFRSVSGRHLLIRKDSPKHVRTLPSRASRENRIRTAAARFGGMGCAQALATAYADLVGLSESEAANLSIGFGEGMGRQLTCGAVTVMLMLAGLGGKGEKCPELFEEFEREMGSSACDYFLEKNAGHGQCRDLLRCAGRLLGEKVFAAETHSCRISREE